MEVDEEEKVPLHQDRGGQRQDRSKERPPLYPSRKRRRESSENRRISTPNNRPSSPHFNNMTNNVDAMHAGSSSGLKELVSSLGRSFSQERRAEARP